ncbi:hypothetical protein JOB18_003056 [Solea senegalensis]|uniref:THAP9-like helix-turn-helix domain-containing protein n=1 Tax=Solea senegalensis TaxID=28829 RepID=A0AAV6RG31_SOLSE|nr:hypothetical protein JOB18_003056 [Solea senegalensis]
MKSCWIYTRILTKQSHEYTKDQREFSITLHLHGLKAYSDLKETLNVKWKMSGFVDMGDETE